MEETWFDYIKLHPDRPWDYYHISANPNITWEHVEANPHITWNYSYLSENPMTKHKYFKNGQLSYVLK